MKDLSIEQKAKRYDEALGKARQLCDYPTSKPFISDLQDLFPELKEEERIREKEDEEVRKELMYVVKGLWEDNKLPTNLPLFDSRVDKWIAWLEKQGESVETRAKEFLINKGYPIDTNGVFPTYEEMYNIIREGLEQQSEQNHDDKVEPKFKVGEWVVFNGLTLLVNEVVQGYYRTISIGGIRYSYDWDIDNVARLWTIQDARNGDVLVCESGWTCIFKTLVNDETFGSYCFMDSTEWFCGLGSECHTLKEEFVKAYNGKIQPAKKEQRDLFFKKMQESGYEWNAEKKVLKNLKPKFKVGDWIVSANGKVNQVISVNADNVDFEGYTLDDDVYFSGTWCNSYHLWTIKDAKEGDVLSYETDEGELWIMIYWSLYEPYEGHVHYHALLVNDDFTDKGTCCICIDNLKPATIEQHELLFRKMKEEGYQWDKNKKEVIKL